MSDKNVINYDNNTALYHNKFGHLKIVEFLNNNAKVKNFEFKDINEKENMLIMKLQ